MYTEVTYKGAIQKCECIHPAFKYMSDLSDPPLLFWADVINIFTQDDLKFKHCDALMFPPFFA